MEFLNNDKKQILTEFVKFVKGELELKSTPVIVIQNGKGKLKTTANYDYTQDKKVVRVNGKNRATIDIMRSLSHELQHHKQFEEGRIKNSIEDGADGSDIENEANAVSGIIIRKYGKIHPEIYEL